MKLLPQRWTWSSLHVVRASAGLSSMFRPTIHFQTNQTDSTCDRTEASVSELLHHISVTTRPSSIQQFIKAHFLLFYWQTDTTVVIILLSDSMKSNCCRSFCWQALVSLPQASAPTRRTALTYKSFNGNQSGRRLTGPLRTSLHAPAFTFTQRDNRKYGLMWRRKPAAELHQWFSRFHIFIIKLKHYNVTQNF